MYDVSVIKGKGLGKTIGYPTLNCIPKKEFKEKLGVYIVRCIINSKEYFGVANLGEQPTIDGYNILLEIHIISNDFNKITTPLELKIEFIKFIRNTEKHESIEKLQRMIGNDVKYARNFLFNKANS